MEITQAQLRRAAEGVNNARLDEAVAAVNMYAAFYGITTQRRMAHFLAQIFHETQLLKRLEENLNYSADGLMRTWPARFNSGNASSYARQPQKIANRAYANRYGNGDEKSGDGWRYRGRGCIQLTFRANYKAYGASELCVGDPVLNPDIIGKFPEAYKSAMWFWERNGLNALADTDNGMNTDDVCRQITKKINGSLNGLSDRLFLLRRFKREFGLK